MHQPEVEILLAAYNGEKYIAGQIESILGQDCDRWRLLIRDDGSRDGTRAICEQYARRYPERISLIGDSLGNLGTVRCFGRLLESSRAPYVMFSDQDDHWLREKVGYQLQAIRDLETRFGSARPAAQFTDAQVVDADLRPIAPSLLGYINRDGDRGRALHRLCVEGNCYGCTMILNRAAVERAGRFPPETISHDWWCGLVVAAFGNLDFAPRTPIQHRRHSSNVSQTKENSWRRYLRERPSLFQHRQWTNRVFSQCEAFDRAYASQLAASPRALFADLARVRQSGWLTRRLLLIRHRVRVTGTAKCLAFYLAA